MSKDKSWGPIIWDELKDEDDLKQDEAILLIKQIDLLKKRPIEPGQETENKTRIQELEKRLYDLALRRRQVKKFRQ